MLVKIEMIDGDTIVTGASNVIIGDKFLSFLHSAAGYQFVRKTSIFQINVVKAGHWYPNK